jgi:uracil-DNA glycosylase family 4
VREDDRDEQDAEPGMSGHERDRPDGQEPSGCDPGEPAQETAEDEHGQDEREAEQAPATADDRLGDTPAQLREDGDQEGAGDQTVSEEDPCVTRRAGAKGQQPAGQHTDDEDRQEPIEDARSHQSQADDRTDTMHGVPTERTGHGTVERAARADDLGALTAEIVECFACPRLVAWREQIAREKVARFRNDPYWGRPVPGFGDPLARILLVGLAPAAHGGNRTGRVFTGDASGDFLWAALHATGFSNRPNSRRADDGLRLTDAYVAAVVRCAPPANKPMPDERDRCLPYLVREIQLLDRVKVIVALGAFAWAGALRALAGLGHSTRPRPVFGHGATAAAGPFTLLGSYHPSQQNTFTGKLTSEMFEAVLLRAQSTANRG